VAKFGAHREGLAVAVCGRFDTREEGQSAALVFRQLANLEDVVRANLDAILLTLATRTVDLRGYDAGGLFAVGGGAHLYPPKIAG
jgi:hypothetical protein